MPQSNSLNPLVPYAHHVKTKLASLQNKVTKTADENLADFYRFRIPGTNGLIGEARNYVFHYRKKNPQAQTVIYKTILIWEKILNQG